jgi:hypothetical protein
VGVLPADFKHSEIVGAVFGKAVGLTHHAQVAILQPILNQVDKIVMVDGTETLGDFRQLDLLECGSLNSGGTTM